MLLLQLTNLHAKKNKHKNVVAHLSRHKQAVFFENRRSLVETILAEITTFFKVQFLKHDNVQNIARQINLTKQKFECRYVNGIRLIRG